MIFPILITHIHKEILYGGLSAEDKKSLEAAFSFLDGTVDPVTTELCKPLNILETPAYDDCSRLEQLYKSEVEAFFKPESHGFELGSYVSTNLWRNSEGKQPESEAQISGPFARIQPNCEHLLVIQEGDHLDTVMGTVNDRKDWEDTLEKERTYHKMYPERSLENKRHIEIWHVHSGCVEQCVKSRKRGDRGIKERIDNVLQWEVIKWKLLDGSFELTDEELILFKKRLQELEEKGLKNLEPFLLHLFHLNKNRKYNKLSGALPQFFNSFQAITDQIQSLSAIGIS